MNPKDLVGSKKATLRYVPPALLIAVGEVMQTGAEKYGPFNWREQPVSTMTYVEAMMRHLLAYMDGQDDAEDSGLSHLAHIAASVGILLDAEASSSRIEDRYQGPAADMLRDRDHSVNPFNGEMKVYPAAMTPVPDPVGVVTCIFCGTTYPDHAIPCPLFDNPVASLPDGLEIIETTWGSEPWGTGGEEEDIFSFGVLGARSYRGTPSEAIDGCTEYRGRHLHPTVANVDTFRDIDRMIDGS